MKIKFEGGYEITSVDLAAAIRQRGELGQHYMYNATTKLFCALGLAKDTLGLGSGHLTECDDWKSVSDLTLHNDRFVGTPAQRAEHMANYLEGLEV